MSDHISGGPIWIIGAGNMAKVYAKILADKGLPFQVVGNSPEGVAAFSAETGLPAFVGGVDAFLESAQGLPRFAVNAVKTPASAHTLLALLDYGVKDILSEKPGGLSVEEVDAVANRAEQTHARVVIGYNRRFFASVAATQRIIAEDGGVTSFQFEFTELYKSISTKVGDVSRWFYGNSTHVLDLAFYLGGLPVTMQSYVCNHEELYTSATRFAGAGVTETGALFSYGTNWLAPGRWGVEVLTRQHRLVLRPMEKLQIQELGSFSFADVPLDDAVEKAYKPGILRQLEAYMADPEDPRLLTVAGQSRAMRIYRAIHTGGTLA